jgi:hypothetical protein
MCMTCGCGEPHEQHGDAANITWEDLERAAKAQDITPAEAMDNMQDAMAKA